MSPVRLIAALTLMTAAADASERDLVVAASGGTIRLRVTVTVDGRPVADRRAAFVESLLTGATASDVVTAEAWRKAFESAGLSPPVAEQANFSKDGLRAALAERLGPAVEVSVQPMPLIDRLELFAALDANDDGRLTPAELAEAERVLARYDADGDHLLTPAELAPAELLAPMPIVSGTDFPADRLPFRWEEPTGNPDAVVNVRLIARAFGRPKVEVKPGPGALQVTAEPRRATITSGGLTLDLDAAPGRLAADDAKRFYLIRLRQLDVDKNGYLDLGEYAGLNLRDVPFASADANGDGMLFSDELATRLDGLIARETSRVRVEAAFGREPLFAKLDGDGDGRLSARELRTAAAAVSELDRDGDGGVGLGDFGGRYRLAFSVPNPLDATTAMPDGMMASAAGSPVTREGPDWFLAMDRNEDGDLSRGEFLGDAERFAALDADGDGFLTGAEAAVAGGTR